MQRSLGGGQEDWVASLNLVACRVGYVVGNQITQCYTPGTNQTIISGMETRTETHATSGSEAGKSSDTQGAC